MRKIIKSGEPDALRQWRRAHPTQRYPALPAEVRQAVRAACIQEQYGLCAYCCQAISLLTAHNEHVQAQQLAPQRTLDFTNIVASCTSLNQCDAAHGRQLLPLTPLMDACETELRFFWSGRIEGLSERARQAITVLNLGDSEERNRSLINRRREMLQALLYKNSMQRDDLEDDELLELFLDDLQQPDADLRLQPYAPVLINVIRQQLAGYVGHAT